MCTHAELVSVHAGLVGVHAWLVGVHARHASAHDAAIQAGGGAGSMSKHPMVTLQYGPLCAAERAVAHSLQTLVCVTVGRTCARRCLLELTLSKGPDPTEQTIRQ